MIREKIFAAVVERYAMNDPAGLAKIEDCFNRTLQDMSKASLPDGTPIILDCLKASKSIPVAVGAYYSALPSISGGDTYDFVYCTEKKLFIRDATKAWGLTKRTRAWFDSQYDDISLSSSSPGDPSDFCIDQGRIYWGPKSNAVLTLTFPYTFLHPKVYSIIDTIYYPDRFEECVVQGTLYFLFDDLDNEAKATKHLGLYQNELYKSAGVDARNIGATGFVKYNDF